MTVQLNRIAQANQDFNNYIVAELTNIRQTTTQILTDITQMQGNVTNLTHTQIQARIKIKCKQALLMYYKIKLRCKQS